MRKRFKAVVIGGSAGSFKPLRYILSNLSNPLEQPIIICLHRLKHIKNGLVEAYQPHTNLVVKEPDDKEQIIAGFVYLAPANYHLIIESNDSFSLTVDELVNFSRPSIDLLFRSAAEEYREGLVGIILSGANTDGVRGMELINEYGGITIVQDPEDCLMNTMPLAVIDKVKVDYLFKAEGILEFLINLN